VSEYVRKQQDYGGNRLNPTASRDNNKAANKDKKIKMRQPAADTAEK
jgi:hypothetical protein